MRCSDRECYTEVAGVIGESVYPVNLIEKPRTLIKHTSGMSGKVPYESED